MRILKFKLPIVDNATVEMYEGAKILDVDYQGNELFVWAMCDETKRKTNYYFNVHGTGHTVPNVYGYEECFFKTVHMRDLGLVWHIFNMN